MNVAPKKFRARTDAAVRIRRYVINLATEYPWAAMPDTNAALAEAIGEVTALQVQATLARMKQCGELRVIRHGRLRIPELRDQKEIAPSGARPAHGVSAGIAAGLPDTTGQAAVIGTDDVRPQRKSGETVGTVEPAKSPANRSAPPPPISISAMQCERLRLLAEIPHTRDFAERQELYAKIGLWQAKIDSANRLSLEGGL